MRGIASAGEQGDREEHRAAAQDRSGQTWSASPCAGSGRVHPGRRSTRGRDALQPSRGIGGGGDDGVVRSPRSRLASCRRDRWWKSRSPVTATFFNAPPSTNPIHCPSGETKGPLNSAEVNTSNGLEGIERTDIELRSVVTHVDDAGSIGRDRQKTLPAEAQRGRPGRRDLQPRDTWRHRRSRARSEPDGGTHDHWRPAAQRPPARGATPQRRTRRA